MRLLGLVAVIFFTWVGLAGAQTIYVSNTSSNVTDASIADALPAFQAAVDEDFFPAWNQRADLVLLASGETAPKGAWTMEFSDFSDISGAAGYHSVDKSDTPYAKVFTQTGLNWQLIFTHELFEMLADPHVNRATLLWPPGPWSHPSKFYLLEVGDPVERQKWAYTRPSSTQQPVVISDFVTERWYDCQGGAPLDFAGHVHHCLHLLDGGYATVLGAERVHGRPAAIFWKGHK